MSDYKKMLFCEHKVAIAMLERQHHSDLKLSCLESKIDDIDMNTKVLNKRWKFLRKIYEGWSVFW